MALSLSPTRPTGARHRFYRPTARSQQVSPETTGRKPCKSAVQRRGCAAIPLCDEALSWSVSAHSGGEQHQHRYTACSKPEPCQLLGMGHAEAFVEAPQILLVFLLKLVASVCACA